MVTSLDTVITTMIEELESFSAAFDSAWEGTSADNLKNDADAPKAIIKDLQDLKGTVGKLKTILADVETAKSLSVEYNKYLSLSYDSNIDEGMRNNYAYQAKIIGNQLEDLNQKICNSIPEI